MNLETLQFRIALSEDAPALCTLVNSAYRGETSKKGWTTEADLLGGQRIDVETLTQALTTTDSTTLLCFDQSELVGSVYLQNRGTKAYLGMLTVNPELQAGGLGKLILKTAEEWVTKNWGSPCMEMSVIQQRKELIAWYERRGYQPVGRTEPFPYGDERFGLPKVSGLAFLVLEKTLASSL